MPSRIGPELYERLEGITPETPRDSVKDFLIKLEQKAARKLDPEFATIFSARSNQVEALTEFLDQWIVEKKSPAEELETIDERHRMRIGNFFERRHSGGLNEDVFQTEVINDLKVWEQ